MNGVRPALPEFIFFEGIHGVSGGRLFSRRVSEVGDGGSKSVVTSVAHTAVAVVAIGIVKVVVTAVGRRGWQGGTSPDSGRAVGKFGKADTAFGA